MYICICKGVTDQKIRQCVQEGHTSLRAVARELGIATQCGKCAHCANALICQNRKQS